MVYALMDCVSAEEQYKFNSEKGLLTYYEPFVTAFCIQINNAPAIGNYFQATKNLPNAEEIEALVSDPKKNGFVGPLLRQQQQTTQLLQAVYSIGDKMKSFVTDATDTVKQQNYNGFPIPKPDSFGICSNFKSAHFMQDDHSSCTQMADVETECESLLNSEFYSSRLKYLLGQGGVISDAQRVEVTEIYTHDEQTGEYEQVSSITDATIKSTMTKVDQECTCANYMKEI